jgi:uncharacterized protein YcbK (DUF882 family)
MSCYGIYRADQIISFVQGKIQEGAELPVEYLQWTVPICTALIAARPVQMGLTAIRRPQEAEEPMLTGTNNFDISEFDSKDGAKMPEEVRKNIMQLIAQLEVIRAACGSRPISITSGYRSPSHNASIPNAAKGSQHLYGKAADFLVAGQKPSDTVKVVKRLMDEGKIIPGGLAYERGFVHYDTRGHYATWKY